MVRVDPEAGGHRGSSRTGWGWKRGVYSALAATISTSTLNSGSGETLDDHQGRSRRRRADVAIAYDHVGLQMLSARHVGVDPDDVGKAHPGRGEDLADRPEAELGLRARILGHRVIAADAELARDKQQPVAGRHLDRMAVGGEGRSDGRRREGAHRWQARSTGRPGRRAGGVRAWKTRAGQCGSSAGHRRRQAGRVRQRDVFVVPLECLPIWNVSKQRCKVSSLPFGPWQCPELRHEACQSKAGTPRVRLG